MENILFIGGVGFQEILLIALVVLLFFGGKKIPELMKGLGKGVRSFKEGMNGKDDDDAGNSTRWGWALGARWKMSLFTTMRAG